MRIQKPILFILGETCFRRSRFYSRFKSQCVFSLVSKRLPVHCFWGESFVSLYHNRMVSLWLWFELVKIWAAVSPLQESKMAISWIFKTLNILIKPVYQFCAWGDCWILSVYGGVLTDALRFHERSLWIEVVPRQWPLRALPFKSGGWTIGLLQMQFFDL